MPPSSPRRPKRTLTSRMLKAFGDFRKKKPVTLQPKKPVKAIKAVRKPMPKKQTVVPAPQPAAPKKITPPIVPLKKTAVPKEVRPSVSHNLVHKVEFHRDGLFIDGIKYKVLAESGISDEELTIENTSEEDGATTLKLHTMGRTFTVTLRQKDIDAMLEHLLRGRAHKTESVEGTVIRIERQMY